MTVKRQVKEKKRLEKKLQPKMAKFLRQLNADTEVIWKATGQLPDFSFYETDLTAILRDHYRLVSKSFSSAIRDDLKKSNPNGWEIKQDFFEDLDVVTTEEEESRVEELILVTLLLYIANHSLEQAKHILNTVNSDYDKIINKVIGDAAAQGINITRAEVADDITDIFNDRIKSKADVISLTETQNMAERSKLIEASILLGSALAIGGELISSVLFKVWNTILDGKERLHHHIANGQIVRIDQPFIVNGEQLMHPSDTELGASPGNIINCRCTSTFTTQ